MQGGRLICTQTLPVKRILNLKRRRRKKRKNMNFLTSGERWIVRLSVLRMPQTGLLLLTWTGTGLVRTTSSW